MPNSLELNIKNLILGLLNIIAKQGGVVYHLTVVILCYTLQNEYVDKYLHSRADLKIIIIIILDINMFDMFLGVLYYFFRELKSFQS